MEIDEKLFHWAWKTKKRLSRKKFSENCCSLDSVRMKLTTIATALYGDTVFVKQAESHGGFIGNSLFLPGNMDISNSYQSNYEIYLARLVIDCLAMSRGYLFKDGVLSESDLTLLSLIMFPTIIELAISEYPRVGDILEREKENLLKEIRPSKNKKLSSFLYHWQKSIIDPQYIKSEANIDDRYKDIIRELISLKKLSVIDLIQMTLIYKKKLKEVDVELTSDFQPFMFLSSLPTGSQRLFVGSAKDSKIESRESNKSDTFKKSKSKERVKKVVLDESNPDCNPAHLLMESVKTADIFSGGNKMVDGADELDEHLDAIEDLDIREITRSSTQAKSVFQADISIDTEMEFDEEDLHFSSKTYHYDEWNHNKRNYRKNWCSLLETKFDVLTHREDVERFSAYYQDVLKKNHKKVKELRSHLENILIKRSPKNRQIDGPDIDLDAAITAYTDIKTGHTASERLYVSSRKSRSDLSVLILLDSSLSSDSYVNGLRVMDVAKESLIVIEKVLGQIIDNTMIAGFYSNTRKDCRFNILKDFDEKWENVSSRLDRNEPSGYTRIGVALRHCFEKLSTVNTKKKVVLMLSDGKPTDYDVYEGKYGINDVRQCVREGKSKNIEIFSLAIEKDAKFYFPQLFGAKNYQVLSSPNELPTQVIKLFSKLI